MKYRVSALAFLLTGGVLFAAAIPVVAANQDKQSKDADASLAARVAELEKKLAEEMQHTEYLELRLEGLTLTLGNACAALTQGVSTSRATGFEWAGPNPSSKTQLLDALLKFTSGVDEFVNPKKEEPAQRAEDKK